MPYIEAKNASAHFEHEATTSKISDDKLFYCRQRGLSAEEAVALIVNGFVRDVLQQLPMEFMAETQKLIGGRLEGGGLSDAAQYWFSSETPRLWRHARQLEGLGCHFGLLGPGVLVVPFVLVASQQNPGSALNGWAIAVWALIVAR